ncbi:sorting nexin-31 isoform X3 [Hippopotamus amphibius kiboko]|uniref:sorting nexin-31 isoform X3 n=1 Tax=Hippopotamus amphibius kiboko TaxID=575201 RepID=UPI002596FB6F|nr:sorting nexin-31 isoform X3 [Hippopotamus amphibius kiboko]
MKMHFCIPVSQQRTDALGGRYVLYSVYLDGFLFCKVRYSQLHRWNEQLRRVFGNCLPPFPPKYYLAMTASMADERRDQLEQYLQNGAMLRHQGCSELCSGPVRLAVQRSWPFAGLLKSVCRARLEEVTVDSNMLRSDVFVGFLKLVQLDTFSITTKRVSLDIFLPDGRSIKVEILTSDTAERVLEVVSHKIGLCRELLGYFGLFLIQFYKDGQLSVIKKLADFELPYISLRSSEVENGKVGLRKWYLDPSLDSRLMDCRAAVDLIYMQAIQDIEKEWTKPTEVQRQKLEALQKEDNQTKGTLLDTDGPQHTLNQNLELRLQYNEDSHWQWFVISTKQAFLLSSCLKKMISEKMVKQAAENPEMQIEVPEQGKSKTYHSQQSQMDHIHQDFRTLFISRLKGNAN